MACTITCIFGTPRATNGKRLLYAPAVLLAGNGYAVYALRSWHDLGTRRFNFGPCAGLGKIRTIYLTFGLLLVSDLMHDALNMALFEAVGVIFAAAVRGLSSIIVPMGVACSAIRLTLRTLLLLRWLVSPLLCVGTIKHSK